MKQTTANLPVTQPVNTSRARKPAFGLVLGLGLIGLSVLPQAANAQDLAKQALALQSHAAQPAPESRPEPQQVQPQQAALPTAAPHNGFTYHPWLNDPIVEAVAAGQAPARVTLTDEGYTTGLCGAVQRYREIVEAGGWPEIADPGEVLKAGIENEAVPALRRRLQMTGDLPRSESSRSLLFDAAVNAAVKRFQSRHGLHADGEVGPVTLAALNVSANIRLATLVINIERARQWGDNFGDRFIAVNIADSRLNLVDDGQTMFDSRVIVGRIDRTTPIIHSTITRIDFNPYWHAPDSIARRDLLAAIQNDPDYFWNNGIRAFSDFSANGHEIPIADIDWYEYDGAENLPFKLRQDPGPWNVLGPVRFNFANSHSVYLHGTSNEALFQQATRTFSSGCVRVDGALDVASYLVSQTAGWDPERVQDTIANYKSRSVKLDKPIPVHLIYRTAWVEHDGTVQFRPDIYDWDAVLDITWGHVADVPCVYGVRSTADAKVVNPSRGG